MSAGANGNVDPRVSGADHGNALYLDCETTGLDVDAKITCVAVTGATGKTTTWHSGHAECMTREMASSVVDFLVEATAGGATLYTFNGAAFDLRLLWQLSQRDELKALATAHCDVLVDFVADARYYSSMDSFAVATLGKDNAKTNSGGWAATAWFDGGATEVLEYCVHDTTVLKQLVETVAAVGRLSRLTKATKTVVWVAPSLDGTIRTVETALKNANPVPAWMSDPPALPDVSWTE